MIKNLSKAVLSIGLALMILSCATLGLHPKTLDQKIAVTEALVIATIDTIAQQVESGFLTVDQGMLALGLARDARSAINNAWYYLKLKNKSEALLSLEIASKITIELNKYLQKKESER